MKAIKWKVCSYENRMYYVVCEKFECANLWWNSVNYVYLSKYSHFPDLSYNHCHKKVLFEDIAILDIID